MSTKKIQGKTKKKAIITYEVKNNYNCGKSIVVIENFTRGERVE